MGDRLDTACYRELGAELRKRREAAGLTTVVLAHKLGWSVTRVSRSELGHLRLSVVDVITYLAFCGVYGNYGAELHAMCREAEPKPGHWLRRHESGLPDATRSLIYHESTASASTSYEPELVPGLLQTEAYIRALTANRWPNWDPEFAVRIRKERQRILYEPLPGQFTFYVHENALGLAVGDAPVMHEQVLALLLLDGLPHVSVRVVPAATALGGSFCLFEYTDHNSLVYLEGAHCGLFLEDSEYVDDYRRLIPIIADLALAEGQSRACLACLAGDYDREGTAHDTVEEK